MARVCGGGRSGAPVVDMIDVSDSTRAGCRMASVWAIIPPIDAPTTCAAGKPRASSRAAASSAMSPRLYGEMRSAYACTRFARPWSLLERPQSRLSNRITWNPCPARVSQNSSSHQIIGEPRPMMSSKGRPAGSPNVS